jgi:hypothetical protein
MTDLTVYEKARRHGLGHEDALQAVARGKVTCWCGSTRVCEGGAQRHVGCPTDWERFLADAAKPMGSA